MNVPYPGIFFFHIFPVLPESFEHDLIYPRVLLHELRLELLKYTKKIVSYQDLTIT